MKNKLFLFVYILLMVIGIIYNFNNIDIVETFAFASSKKVIYIDAGHGGFDPGVISGDIYEKDINLEIALKLQKYFEQSGAYVIVSRLEDEATSSNKKGDMYTRKLLANDNSADVLISIHQNSFSNPSVQGSQVFYYESSEKSKLLAEKIKDEIKAFANFSNTKDTKPNTSYYLLKQTTIPSVIVECGFLTNSNDLYKLRTDDYQDKIAWAIYIGTLKYFDDIG